MDLERASGIILHPTSLPGPYGIGDLGPEADRWLDFLHKSKCGLWQVLPLGPTGYGDSPYQCFSAFAGNPYLISPDLLVEAGLLEESDVADRPAFPADRVDFGAVIRWKLDLLRRAFRRFLRKPPADFDRGLRAFREEQAAWLADFALFMALKDEQAGQAWVEWPLKIRLREAEALTGARDRLQEDIQRHEFQQYVFFQQWARIREKAHALGIRIIGDIPIFVALDSADVWSNPGLFHLDEEGQPTVVAGVPPDYFSATGQRWGNPLYRWQVHADQGYVWWLDRLRAVLGLVDVVRLDHFRGFAGYWEIPASAETAVQGRWVAAPGMRFFEAVRRDLGELSIIAEDLGEITPDVVELRERFGLPGMKVLMFAFSDDPENDFLPHHHVENCVVYTGTHDNDTAEGWYQRVEEAERDFFRRYLQVSGDQVARSLIRAAWRSVARYALTTMQDLLDLDNEARMNYPGRPGGNWAWRMPEGALSEELRDWLREINYLYGRENQAPTTPAR